MAIPASRRVDFSEIPQLDVASLVAGRDDPALIEALRDACTNAGFFYVRNHGVDSSRINEMRAAAERFFALPEAAKMTYRLNRRMQGYLPLDYTSSTDELDKAKSHQEGFWIGYERAEHPDRMFDGPNIWPAGHDDLRATMLAYQASVEHLSRALLRGFALAAGMPPERLASWFGQPITRLKLNHYPPQETPESVRHIGVVPHSDSDAFTILWQDDGDGLEIRNLTGEWIRAPSIPGTFVINIGNIMQMWTGGSFASTPHRVINAGGRDRYSIPVFVYPDHDVRIGPLDHRGQAPRDAVTCAEYLRASWRRSFPIANIPAPPG